MEIKVLKGIMSANECIAAENRIMFKKNNITAVNIMASPGAGKTSLIVKMIEELINTVSISVVEGDIASNIDAEKIDKLGIPVVQINTGGGCHLDASMIRSSVESLALKDNTLLLIENVGNLVCPSAFDLGENIKLVIASVPEGDDKPYKYISMFEAADVIILNKIDLMPYMDFNRESFYKGITALNQKSPVFEVSLKTGEGIDKF
ncbi:MAG: hydrogenase nickel incorporation protein HypB, partial [Clostridiaceae bacterium]|nr:hydrogenase nickel incorporation protein HypB [Clostridiaceae bacterium]